MPIEKSGDVIVMRGCKAHQCGIEEAILVIHLANGNPYVTIKFGDRFRTFPADRSLLPDALKQAMKS